MAGRRGPAAPACSRSDGSRRPSSRRSGRVIVASSRSAARRHRCRRPASRRASRRGVRPPCRRAAASSSGAVSSPVSGSARWATIGPLSRPASMSISVTPVSSSPARIAAGIGVAPRWRGNNDGCRFSAPCRGRSSIACGHDLAVVGEHDQLGLAATQAGRPTRAPQSLRAQRRQRSDRPPRARPADRRARPARPAGWAAR